ncbi:GHKL domain-containing protein [Lactonifactor longoviformis]|uniref:sensor histidine kinase n=2 Tax=Clostridiaceae TaxID=31979 RepID=UPI0012AF1F11|nr:MULTISPECIES: GHKL domain-containing protein [Lactonifactor]MCQ4672723.1 GHKL domain-containing protein [Lactonifactor longoviformis]MSA02746.1 GHKL domain-containing protein [Lactonifactor sp. BIOML-A5]MSA09297.1 GHKL domain-containing protein [Lactonifactor sp. BIOML-A4]MSA13824.1 GHKL domain-containing protein [Lactonifactor sp. BIOML-A3]MSA18352.1 GHKL domain-containing protein [Lactonifactor sp. BIOML-A2]
MEKKKIHLLHKIHNKLLFMGILAFTVIMAVISCHLLFIYLFPLSGEYKNISVMEPGNEQEWELYTNEQGTIKSLSTADGYSYTGLDYEGQTYYMSRKIQENYSDIILEIDAVTSQISIFLDEDLLYTDNSAADNRIGYVALSHLPKERPNGLRLSLPPDCLGKTLTIAACQPFAEASGDLMTIYPCNVSVYSTYALESLNVSSATKTAYPAILLAILGFFLLSLFLYQCFHREADWGLFFLAFFCLLWMADVIFRSPYFGIYFGYKLDFAEIYLRYGSVSFLMLFLFIRMNRCRKIYLPFVVLQLISLICLYLTNNTTIVFEYPLYGVLLNLPEYAGLTGLLVIFIFMIPELKKGNGFYRMLGIFTVAALAAVPVGAILYALQFIGSSAEMNNWITQYLQSYTTEIRGPYYYMLIVSCFLSFSSFIISLYRFILGVVRKYTSIELLRLKNELAQESYRQLNQYTEQVMMLRHDEKKHFSLLATLLEKNDSEKALEYTYEIIQRADDVTPIVNTQNYMINTIVNSKLSSAMKEGIQITIRHASAPEKLNIADSDLCSLLMNVLDNALAATSLLEEKDRYITLNLYVKNNFLCIYCENGIADKTECKEEKDVEGIKAHGYGLIILEKIVDRYKGILDIKQVNQAFIVNIALPV